MNAIELSHIHKSFGGFAIQDLSLTVPSGTICGLVGENGAGKSTTIRLLMNALRPDGGTARVLGVDASSPEFRAVKEDVGVVLDEAYYPETLNTLQVGKVMAGTYKRWDQGTYERYLRRFDLPEKKLFKDFSRGMKMKLAIAAALAQGLLDHGINLVSGGTDNHMMLLDLRGAGVTGKELERRLDEVYITVNKNAIPNDPEKPFVTSGIRVGTPAVTTRGLREADMTLIARCIVQAATDFEEQADSIRETVNGICARYPLYE